jgi:AraC-like DNA-binding protein
MACHLKGGPVTIRHSTKDVAAHESIAYWREVANKEFARHDFSTFDGRSFRGDMRITGIGSVGLCQFDCAPCHVERKASTISSYESDNFLFLMLRSGCSTFEQDGREVRLSGGGMTLIDLQRPSAMAYLTNMETLSVSIPRSAIEARLPDVRTLTVRSLGLGKPLSGLLAGFIGALPLRADAFTTGGERIAEQLLDLIVLALSLEAEENGVTLASPKAITLLRLKAAADARLSDPNAGPAIVAAAAGISIRYANLLLSEEGFSVDRYIQYRRLERCRAALEDENQAGRTIGEIAFGWGFRDLSHFGRRFKAEFGLSPSDYRRRASEAAATVSRWAPGTARKAREKT